jgi:hypothetical protein
MPFLFIPKPLDKNFMVFITRYRGLPKVREQSSLLPFSNTLKSGLAPFEGKGFVIRFIYHIQFPLSAYLT